jgi:hypothetical protein
MPELFGKRQRLGLGKNQPFPMRENCFPAVLCKANFRETPQVKRKILIFPKNKLKFLQHGHPMGQNSGFEDFFCKKNF